MAVRLEREESGEKAIVIDGWQSGIAPDPYSGLNRMFQVDLEVPGEVAVGYSITASTTSGITLGNPIAGSKRYFNYADPATTTSSIQSFAILDAAGHVFESTTYNGTFAYLSASSTLIGASSLEGCIYWLGYLWKTRGALLDYWDGSAWSTSSGWQTDLSGSVPHFMYVATDDILYITNGNYIASLSPNGAPASFDPTNSDTYTWTAKKLQIALGDIAVSLGEVGYATSSGASTLLIGGQLNAIYPWDKTSVSFGLPMYIADTYIARIVSVNQTAYLFAGGQSAQIGQSTNLAGRGRIYVTNGSQATLFFKIPDYLFGVQDPCFIWGDAIFHRNNLLFGFFIAANSSVSTYKLFAEVWALSLSTHETPYGVAVPSKQFRAISNINAATTGIANATTLLSLDSQASPGFGYILGWNDSGTHPGIGYSGTTAGIGTSDIITDLIPVGTFTGKKTFSQVEFKLRTPLQSGESISILPIVDGVTQSALVFSPTGSTVGTIASVAPINFTGAQWLQFEIQQTGNSATSGCRLKEIRVR